MKKLTKDRGLHISKAMCKTLSKNMYIRWIKKFPTDIGLTPLQNSYGKTNKNKSDSVATVNKKYSVYKTSAGFRSFKGTLHIGHVFEIFFHFSRQLLQIEWEHGKTSPSEKHTQHSMLLPHPVWKLASQSTGSEWVLGVSLYVASFVVAVYV